jgi:hypothetical protein
VTHTNGKICTGPIPDGPGNESVDGLLRLPLTVFPNILVLYRNEGLVRSDGADVELIKELLEFIVIFRPVKVVLLSIRLLKRYLF